MLVGIQRRWFVAVVLLLTPAGVAAQDSEAESEKKDEPKKASVDTHEIKREPFRIEVKLSGTFEPVQAAPISVRPKAWTSLQVAKTVSHGTRVSKGDPILWFDTQKIDEQLRESENSLELGRIALELAQIAHESGKHSAELTREEAKRTKERAAEELEYYEKRGQPLAEKSADFSLQSSRHRLDYAMEELKQLEKMYKEDDLTEETEEIVLKRAKHDVDYAKYSLENSTDYHRRTMEVTIPQRLQQLKDAARKAEIELERFQASDPLDQRQKELTVHKLQREQQKLEQRMHKLRQDREAMVVRAPIDGVVYYGSIKRGRISDASTMESRLRPGGTISLNEVFMTVVATDALQLRADVPEKDLHRIRVGRRGKASLVAFPNQKLDARVTRVGQVPIRVGSFDATLVLEADPQNVSIMPGMKCDLAIMAYHNRNAIVVPESAVFEEDGDSYVYVHQGDKDPERRVVKTGERHDKKVEILEGVKVGEKIRMKKPE